MGRPKSRTSWVWNFARREGNKAYCMLCNVEENNSFYAGGGSTGAITNHLRAIHGKAPSQICMRAHSDSDESVVDFETSRSLARRSTGLQRKCHRSWPHQRTGFNRPCNVKRSEEINQAVVKLIAHNQLPLSFVSSDGFKKFMAVIEPNYKVCSGGVARKRLELLADNLKEKVQAELSVVSAIACTSDCWSSRSQDSYLSLTAHFIDNRWCPKSFTLKTREIDGRHTSVNLRDTMESVMQDWGVMDKVVAIVTDNATNMVNAAASISQATEKADLTCAAHSLHLVANKVLAMKEVAETCQRVGKVVSHFRHSNLAAHTLGTKQQQLGLPTHKLIQSVSTRWNSTFEMLERILQNRQALVQIIADRKLTSAPVAQRLEISEREWIIIEILVKILKPIQVLTNVLCGCDFSPVSMVRPLVHKLLKNHMLVEDNDDQLTMSIKRIVTTELKHRFHLMWEEGFTVVTTRLVASFLDPRYKNLDDESMPARKAVREYVQRKLEDIRPSSAVDTEQAILYPSVERLASCTALEYLYNEVAGSRSGIAAQVDDYISEPSLMFSLDPFEWWRSRERRYPDLAAFSKRYLCIPSSSASSERVFSIAGNIVTPRRNCLAPDNVDLLVFLHENRKML